MIPTACQTARDDGDGEAECPATSEDAPAFGQCPHGILEMLDGIRVHNQIPRSIGVAEAVHVGLWKLDAVMMWEAVEPHRQLTRRIDLKY